LSDDQTKAHAKKTTEDNLQKVTKLHSVPLWILIKVHICS
jgi:hypothetical protein